MTSLEDAKSIAENRIANREAETNTLSLDEDTPMDISVLLDSRMSELPDNQKEFFLDHLTPETLAMIGLILGDPAIEFFQPMTDMKKKISIVDRELTNVDDDVESITQEAQSVSVEETPEVILEDQFTI